MSRLFTIHKGRNWGNPIEVNLDKLVAIEQLHQDDYLVIFEGGYVLHIIEHSYRILKEKLEKVDE